MNSLKSHRLGLASLLAGLLILIIPFRSQAQLQFVGGSPVLDLGSPARHLAMADGFAYVATASGLAVCDIRNPAHPAIRTNLTALTGSDPISVYIAGRRIYVMGYLVATENATNSIAIFELDEPGLPKLKGILLAGTPGVFCATRGSMLFATTRTNGVIIWDVTDAALPVEVGRITGIPPSLLGATNQRGALFGSAQRGISGIRRTGCI